LSTDSKGFSAYIEPVEFLFENILPAVRRSKAERNSITIIGRR